VFKADGKELFKADEEGPFSRLLNTDWYSSLVTFDVAIGDAGSFARGELMLEPMKEACVNCPCW
jgi:hypothetical protein